MKLLRLISIQLLILIGVIISYNNVFAEEQTIVGEVDASGEPTLLVDESTLIDAFEEELDDGTVFEDVWILHIDQEYYIAGGGTKGDTIKTVKVLLRIDEKNDLYISATADSYWGCETDDCYNTNNKYCCGLYSPDCACDCTGTCSMIAGSLDQTAHIAFFY